MLVVLAGYLVRFPLGGYAWQAAHYLLGLRALGHDAWFYEDTGHHAFAYDPTTHGWGPEYGYGVGAARAFLERVGLGERWVFVDAQRGEEHGPGAGRAKQLLRDADLVLNLGGVNRIPPEARGGRPSIYVDIDPGYTQIKLDQGDRGYREILSEHATLFTFGENIGTARSPLPTGGFRWHPTRQPVAVELWGDAPPLAPDAAFTTIGKWDSAGRDLAFRGDTYSWRKRPRWLEHLELPWRTRANFEVAMDVDSGLGDRRRLEASGWAVVDPIAVSVDPWRYRDYVRASAGEFTVAKDLNVRLRSGWFSDRAACYLAAGRPCVEEDTAFGDVLPLGPGLHAFRTTDEAVEAVRAIRADPARASAHAREVADACFRADKVVARMLETASA
jgi:hypothetical protein